MAKQALFEIVSRMSRERDKEILAYLKAGKTQKEISALLQISPQRVNQIVLRLREQA